MDRTTLLPAAAICSCLALGSPLRAAETPTPPAASNCLAAVRDLSVELGRRGYWMSGAGYGFGYGYGDPMGMYGVGYGMGLDGGQYRTARPSYEIRTLIGAAALLGRDGDDAQCEAVLQVAKIDSDRYVSELQAAGYQGDSRTGLRQRQIEAAQPVGSMTDAFRSDQLLNADVVSPGNEVLGTVHDLVMSPGTGKIAYVIVARGGLFGIDADYTPIPWGDFKATPAASLLVLDATKAMLVAAPQSGTNRFTKPGAFVEESKRIDAYWAAHVKVASAAP